MSRRGAVLLIVCWAIAAGAGLNALMVYKGRPGVAGESPASWPRPETVALPSGKPLLLMFAHPRCPCTKASIAELEILVARAKDKFEAAVFFYTPPGEPADWHKTATVAAARSIPGVRVLADAEGRLANQFGAVTSGHTVVYSADGRLLFSGGITGSRGHIGDNAALETISEVLGNRARGEEPRKTLNTRKEFFLVAAGEHEPPREAA